MFYCCLFGRVCTKLSWGRAGGATISVKVQQKLRKFSRYVACRAILPDFCITHLEIE